MKFTPTNPPRRFEVGLSERIELADCGRVELAPDEQVTFVTGSGTEYDVVRKAWGYYATPSVNGRLPRFNLRAALLANRRGQRFVVLVERGHEDDFDAYCRAERLAVVAWLDDESGPELAPTGARPAAEGRGADV